MNIEELREYCLSKKGATESFPFDDVTLVFKVGNKMFALTSLNEDLRVNLKCDPEKTIELRENYEYVIPGYHMSKKHWISVILTGNINDKLVYSWIDESYDLVVAGLTKKERILLNNNYK